MPGPMIHFNGVNAVTGEVRPPASPEDIVRAADGFIRPTRPPRVALAWRAITRSVASWFGSGPTLGLPYDVDPTNVRSAGWAVVLAHDLPPAARSAAARLHQHRLRHTGVPADRCKLLEFPAGATLGEWLRSESIRAHLADIEPTRLPYYVLLVGHPGAISFEFQTSLDAHYAVGRLAFDDPEGYDRYISGLIDYETGAAPRRAREVVYYAVRNPGDEATRLSADHLIRPLYAGDQGRGGEPGMSPVAVDRGFEARLLDGPTATRSRLLEILHADAARDRPAVLFTASHGLECPAGHPRQRADQGALVCGEWPGRGTIPSAGHCVGAADLGDIATPHGLVAIMFACYAAGTPAADPFPFDRSRGPTKLTDVPFVAAFPQRLLGHPNGTALAVLGHVDRTCEYSIAPPGLSPRTGPFRSLLGRILRGEPVGHATRDFGDRFAAANDRLTRALDPADPGPRLTAEEVAGAWFERNDAQYYVTLGDPAARLNPTLLLPTS